MSPPSATRWHELPPCSPLIHEVLSPAAGPWHCPHTELPRCCPSHPWCSASFSLTQHTAPWQRTHNKGGPAPGDPFCVPESLESTRGSRGCTSSVPGTRCWLPHAPPRAPCPRGWHVTATEGPPSSAAPEPRGQNPRRAKMGNTSPLCLGPRNCAEQGCPGLQPHPVSEQTELYSTWAFR